MMLPRLRFMLVVRGERDLVLESVWNLEPIILANYLSFASGRTSQVAPVVKNLPASVGDVRDVGLTPGLGRVPGVHGNTFQHFCLENPMDRGAWQATASRIPKSRIQLKQLNTHAC